MITKEIYKDYTLKITAKIYGTPKQEESVNINNLIIFFNYCFKKRNNFFIDDFYKKSIFKVCLAYNKLKANVLSPDIIFDICEIFSGIEGSQLSTIRYILYKYVNNYNSIVIKTAEEDSEFCTIVTKESIQECIKYLERYINQHEQYQQQ